jgi:hypothetical protein
MLQRWYAYGEGAVIAKHLRMGDRQMATVAMRIMAENLRFLAANLRHRRLTGLGQLVYRGRGLARGLVARVDRSRKVFVG